MVGAGCLVGGQMEPGFLARGMRSGLAADRWNTLSRKYRWPDGGPMLPTRSDLAGQGFEEGPGSSEGPVPARAALPASMGPLRRVSCALGQVLLPRDTRRP